MALRDAPICGALVLDPSQPGRGGCGLPITEDRPHGVVWDHGQEWRQYHFLCCPLEDDEESA
jgi:hypothetical protein